jgi:signal recognition particle receptor subunit beta
VDRARTTTQSRSFTNALLS